jgi:hypothetical protein
MNISVKFLNKILASWTQQHILNDHTPWLGGNYPQKTWMAQHMYYGLDHCPIGPYIKGLVPRQWLCWEVIESLRLGPDKRSFGHWEHTLKGASRTLHMSTFLFISWPQSEPFCSIMHSCHNVYHKAKATESVNHGLEPPNLWTKNKPFLLVSWLSLVFVIIMEIWLTWYAK